MGTVISLDTHRHRVRTPLTSGIGAIHYRVDDLMATADDHTRRLLARGRHERRGWLVPRSLLAADLFGLSLAYVLTTLFWRGAGGFGSFPELLVFLATLPCWALVAKLHGLYRTDQEHAAYSTADDVVRVFHLVTVGVWVLLVASRLAGRTDPSIYAVTTFWALAFCALPLARAAARLACRRSAAYEQNALIVGAGEVGQLIARKLVDHPEYGVNVVGFIDRDPKTRRIDLPDHMAILGSPERLPEIVKCLDVERVIIAFSNQPLSELLSLLRQLRQFPVQIDLVPRLFELVAPRATLHAVEGVTLLGLPQNSRSRTSRMIKRAIDVAGAGIALLALAPVFAYIAFRIRRDSDGPIFFRQTRLGMNMKEFTALRFRTTTLDSDRPIRRITVREIVPRKPVATATGLCKLEHADATTIFGARLRRTSLDKLPELLNVLKGDMSLVGPGPSVPHDAEISEPEHLERFAMPQGLTGLRQVTARANGTLREGLDLDIAYIRGWSLGLDLRLLLRTPLAVLRRRPQPR